ncbi:MAG: preprotein translocase subunit SecE [Candidatus Dormiibacterota bacterium]
MANVPRGERPESDEGGYLREVWSELRKTVWPTWPELRQMTGVVIVTVVLLGAFLGLLDFGLTSALKPLYTSPAPTAAATATPTPTAAVSPTPTPSATPSATATTSP